VTAAPAAPPVEGVRRRKYGSGHGYTIDGRKVPGVTSILRMMPKDGLINWAAGSAADYATDHWAELAELPLSVRRKRIFNAHNEDRDTAARRGTQVHRLAMDLIDGVEVTVPDELSGHVWAYIDFLDRLNVQPVAVELVVANRTENYCGTLDLIADLPALALQDGDAIPAARWLLDLKTSRSGIWPETALQCTGYARAETYVADDGSERPLAEFGELRTGAVHVRADGWDLRPVVSGPVVWEYFRHLAWLAAHAEELRGWVGEAVDPPPPPLDPARA
jgi:hypothetical protein